MQVATADVVDEQAIPSAFEQVVSRDGRLHILVHCAGIIGPSGKKITEVDVDAFDLVYRVNLRGSFLITPQALRHMLPKDYGRILLFASIAGKEGNAGMWSYSTTRAGVITPV